MGFLCLLGPLVGVPAVICGHIALSRIKRSANLLGGRGLAITGLILGYTSFLMIPVIGLLAAIAIPNFVRAKITVESNQCVNQMRAIDGAIQQWALAKGKKDTDAIDEAEVAKSMSGGVIPTCPAGGQYIFAPTVSSKPTVTCPNESAGPPPLHKL
jgi:hypothetical protein